MGSVAGKDNGSAGGARSPPPPHPPLYRRRAHHAGSWYEDDPDALRRTLTGYLTAAASDAGRPEPPEPPRRRVRAVICPHAGYAYSGPTAAYGYHAVLAELRHRRADSPTAAIVTQILVLHPSHHVHLPSRCAVSNAVVLETPVGNLRVDDALRREILQLDASLFTTMTASVDEREHSGEMQYPYLAHCLAMAGRLNDGVTVTPVLCGALSTADEAAVGALLAPIVARSHVLTVVSTDFCHWGRRFGYQPVAGGDADDRDRDDDTDGGVPIHEFIERLDRRGMDAIAALQPGAFADYLKETRNTVCGRHAVAVWLRAVTSAAPATTSPAATPAHYPLSVRFVRYAQSSPSRTLSDSSVSYAAAVATVDDGPR